MTTVLSVVVASNRAPALLDECLESLAPQCRMLEAELIVARAGGSSSLPAGFLERHPLARVIAAPLDSTIPELRGAGLAAAAGRLVALTEDHCLARPGWLAALARAAGSDAVVVGGGMGNAQPRAMDWAAYFSEYGFFAFTRPAASGEPLITGANVAYSREVLNDVIRWAREGAWENTIHQRLAALGWPMRFVPEARVDQNLTYRLAAFAKDRFVHGRDYALVRVEGASRASRWVRAATCPLLPVVLTRRVATAAGGVDRLAFLKALPITFIFLSAWAAGEASGYLAAQASGASDMQGVETR